MKLPRTKLQTALDVLTWAAVLVQFAVVPLVWGGLPERIPSHFNLAGEADGWSGRGVLLLCPILAALICAGVDFVIHLVPPELWNMPFSVPEARKVPVYSAAKTTLLAVNLEVALTMVPTQLGLCFQWGGGWMLEAVFAMLAGMFLTLGVGIYLAWRRKFEPSGPDTRK